MNELHTEVSPENEQNDVTSILQQSNEKQLRTFDIRDYVLVQIHLEQNLITNIIEPFRVIRKTSDDVLVDLPKDLDFGISSSVNLKDLIAYEGPDLNPPSSTIEPCENHPSENPGPPPPPKLPPFSQADRAEFIDGSFSTSTWDRELREYLVEWKGRPETKDAWIDIKELQWVDLDFWEPYEDSVIADSTESSSLPLGENDVDI